MAKVETHIRNINKEMRGLGVYREEYKTLIKRCAEMRAERDVLVARYRDSGYVTGVSTGAGGEKSSPDMARLGALERNLLALEDRLGVTPSAFRDLGGAEKDDADAMKELRGKLGI